MGEYIDISPKISEQIAVFPGDQPFEHIKAMSFKSGHHLELSLLKTTVHLGAHADAPSHYIQEGVSIAERSLLIYMGLCQVMHVDVPRGQRILPKDLRGPITAPRVLFHTGSYPDHNRWNNDFVALSPELIRHLAYDQVRLVGIDTPSIDPAEDKELLSHKEVAKNDMAILEGLVLHDVVPGNYQLIALPLKLDGVEASPVRAILLPLSSSLFR